MDDYFAGSSTPPQAHPAPQQPWSAAPPAPAYQPPATWAPQAQPAPWAYQPAQQGMSTGVKVLIGVAIGFGGLVILGILAAIAIPVFLNQRTKSLAAHTTVSIPATAAGLALRTDATSEQMAERLNVDSLPGHHLAGAYGGSTRPEALISVTKRLMSPGDQNDYLAGAVRGAEQASGTAVQFGDLEPGALGGRVTCSSAPTVTVCFFVDAGAYGSAVVLGTPERATQLVPQLRAAVEHRT